MKKINNVVRGLLVAVLAFASVAVVFPGMALAASGNESILLSGGVDARAIVTNGGTNYVSDFNHPNVLTVSFPATSSTNGFSGDAAYGLSLAGSNLFVSAGKYDLASTSGGLQVFATSDLSTPLSVYGTDTFTYSKVSVVGSTAFSAYFDGSYFPQLEAVDYTTPASPASISTVALTPAPAADITALAVSGTNAYVAIQDSSSAGSVNIVDISNPSAMSVAGTYLTSDTATSVAVNGTTLYVGHGSSVDVVDVSTPASPAMTSTISIGATVNGLTTDGTYLYVVNGNGLQVYTTSGSLVGTYATTKNATAVSVDGSGFIYVTASDGLNSEVLKTKMVVITLTGANPQTIQLGAGYTELGATVSDGSTPVINSSAFVDAVGSYNITYTAVSGNPGLQVTRIVNVVDNTAPVITLNLPNPQTIQKGSPYTELGATTDDGSLVQINASSVNTAVIGSYSVTYDSIDSSGNNAVQVIRTVNVVASAHTITASAGANGSISPSGAVVVADGNAQSFTITPNAGYSILDVLVDGVSAGAVPTYTFSNVTVNHSIAASFVCNNCYIITASAGANGSISPSGAVQVPSGNDQSFTITPNSGYHIANVLVDGASKGKITSYTFINVIANGHTIVANFARNSGGGSSGGSGGSTGGNGNPNLREIPGCGMRTTGYSTVTGESCANNIPHEEVLGAEKFIFTMLLKRTTPPPYPTKPAAYVNEVMELQKFLNAHGFNSGLVDGKFGPITQSAVIKFQVANGLVGDGIVGPLTRAVLNR